MKRPALPIPDALLGPVAACLATMPVQAAVGVAVSGGPDSVALAAIAAEAARAQGRPLTLLHVHHGLLDQADHWAGQVSALADALGAHSIIRRVRVMRDSGDGLEAAARDARYAALGEMAQQAGLADILLAHHLDDQAETVMFRLLRGAGPAGLAAMREYREHGGMRYHRPWLSVERSAILPTAVAAANAMAVSLADDPSNHDHRHARGALRTAVLPGVAIHWPGYRQTLARLARLSADTAAVLDEIAQADVASLVDSHPRYGATLELDGWRALSPARRALALRRWLADAGAAMPSQARLDQICHQLATAASDRQVLLQHGAHRLRIYRGRILREPTPVPCVASANVGVPAHLVGIASDASMGLDLSSDVVIDWSGQSVVSVPALGGNLRFEFAETGVDPVWLAAAPLRIGLRRGRERLQVAADRPTRSLKNLYQEAGIPAWERPRLPLVWRGGTVLFAAGLGLDARVPQVQQGLQLRWQADAPGATQGRGHDNTPRNAG